MKRFLLLVLLVSWLPAFGVANTLTRMELRTDSLQDQLVLEFSNEVIEDPIINFDLSNLSLRFAQTRVGEGVPDMTRPEQHPLIRAIRVSPSNDSTLVDIILKTSSSNLPTPEITIASKSLTLVLARPQGVPTEPTPEVDGLTQALDERIRSGDPFLSTFTREDGTVANNAPEVITDDNWTSTLLMMVLALLFILFLIYLLAWSYNKFLSTRFRSPQNRVQIKVASTYHLAPKQKVVVLDMNGQLFACGITPTSINLISVLQDENDQSFLKPAQQEAEPPSLEKSKAEFLKALEAARKHTQALATEAAPPVATPDAPAAAQAPAAPEPPARPAEPASASPGFKTPVQPPVQEAVLATAEEAPAKSDAAEKFLDRFRTLKPIR